MGLVCRVEGFKLVFNCQKQCRSDHFERVLLRKKIATLKAVFEGRELECIRQDYCKVKASGLM